MLEGRGVALLFEKPSARTRSSSEMAVVTLGAHPIYVRGEEVGLDTRETVEDVARTFACYCSVIMARTFAHRTVERIASAVDVPVVNLLSDLAHPTQALADLLTLHEQWGSIDGRRLAYIGDGNNMAASLAFAAALSGMELVVASPPGYELSDTVVDAARNLGAVIELTTEPTDAVDGADAIYTDVWTSMGQESERARAARRVRSLPGGRRARESGPPRRGGAALPARAPRRGDRNRGDRRPAVDRVAAGGEPHGRVARPARRSPRRGVKH